MLRNRIDNMKITFNPVPFPTQYILLFIPYLNLPLIPIFIWNWILQNHNIKRLFRKESSFSRSFTKSKGSGKQLAGK